MPGAFPGAQANAAGHRTTPGCRRGLLYWDADQLFIAMASLAQLVVFGIIALFVLGDGHSKQQEQLAYVLFFAAVPLLSLACWVATRHLAASALIRRVRPWWLRTLMLTVAPALALALGLVNIQRVLYYSYDPIPRVAPFSAPRFALGALIGALIFAGLLLAVLRPVRLRSPRLMTAVCAIFGVVLLLGLIDPYLMIDTLSYSPYVGPAFAVRNGAIPMLETFSQYGPNFLIFAAAFSFAQTFYMASAIVAFLNAAMAMAFVYIATELGLNRLFSFAASIIIVWFVHAAFLYNESYTPSVLAMRFLPPVLLVASLVRMLASRSITLASGAATLLCALWSFEAFSWGFLIYVAWLVVRGVGERRPVARTMRDVAGVLLLVLGPHLVLTLIYLAMFHSPPRYDIYFELVFVHLASNYWLMPVEAGVRAWILFGFVYGSALAYVGYRALAGFADMRRLAGISALAVLGVLQFYYYVGRSATPLLVFISLPMMMLVLLACDWAVGALRMRADSGLPILAAPVLAAALALFGLMGGVFADRMSEPISRDLQTATLLRVCLPGGDPALCSARRMLDLIRGADVAKGDYPPTESGGSLSYTHSENKAEFELVQRFAREPGRRVLLFGTDPVPVIFHSPKDVASQIIYPPHAIGIVYPSVDGLSPILSARAIASLDGLRAGDIVVRGSLPIYDLDQKALQVIESKWTLCPREKLATVTASELMMPGQGTCDARG
jgi:hypothetical protein